MLINRKDVVTFIVGNLSPIFWNAPVLRIVMAFFFRVLRKTDQKPAKNDLEWRMHEVMRVVCGAMFGEERVNNSVDLLSRVLVAFSVGQISALVTVTHFCCNLLLQMLECYWTCSHARLACFLFETNQRFVGSARIAGLCLMAVTLDDFSRLGGSEYRVLGWRYAKNWRQACYSKQLEQNSWSGVASFWSWFKNLQRKNCAENSPRARVTWH